MRLVSPDSRSPVLCEVDEPVAGPGEVLLELLAVGLCHTDVGMAAGDPGLRRGYAPVFPLTLGHEYLGVVRDAGPGTAAPPLGARVVGSAHITCGACRWCLGGRSMLCTSLAVIGLDRDGAFADRFVVAARNVVVVPDDVPDALAVLCEPFAVSAHAVDLARPVAGERVAIVGPGAVGLLALGALAGHEVAVLGRRPDARGLRLARELGATETVVVDDTDPTAIDGDFDVVIETAGHPSAVELATRILGRGGRLVCVGLPPASSRIDSAALARMEQSLIGSRAYDLSTWKTVLTRIARAPKLRSLVTHRLPLTEVGAAFELVSSRRALKVVLEPTFGQPDSCT